MADGDKDGTRFDLKRVHAFIDHLRGLSSMAAHLKGLTGAEYAVAMVTMAAEATMNHASPGREEDAIIGTMALFQRVADGLTRQRGAS